jgi:hypothetical protein
MRRLYVALLAGLVCLGAWAWVGFAGRADVETRDEARSSR